MKTPFKDTKAGQWIKANVPALLDTAENFVPAPIKGGMDIIRSLVGLQPGLAPEKVAEFNQIAAEHESQLLTEQLADVANARQMNVELNKSGFASWLSKDMSAIISILCILAGAFVLTLVGLGRFHCSETLQATIVTGVIAFIGTIVNFWCGSSKGSQDKDKTIAALSQ